MPVFNYSVHLLIPIRRHPKHHTDPRLEPRVAEHEPRKVAHVLRHIPLHQEEEHVVREVVAVVGEEVVHRVGVLVLNALKELFEVVVGHFGCAVVHCPDGAPVVRVAGLDGLDSLLVVVLGAVDFNRGVPNGVDIDFEKGH